MLHVRYKLRRPFFAAKNFVGRVDRIHTGDADERDRAFTRRSGDGSDCVSNGHVRFAQAIGSQVSYRLLKKPSCFILLLFLLMLLLLEKAIEGRGRARARARARARNRKRSQDFSLLSVTLNGLRELLSAQQCIFDFVPLSPLKFGSIGAICSL